MTRKIGSVSPSFLSAFSAYRLASASSPSAERAAPARRRSETADLRKPGIGRDRVKHLARLPPTLVGVVFDQEFRKAKCSIATCVPFGREAHGRSEVGLSRRSVALARIQFTQVLVCHDYVARPGIGLDQTNEKLTSSPRLRVAAVMH